MPSISISKGAGNIKHNTRTQSAAPKNVALERTHLNENLVHLDIQSVYSELFDEAVNDYNKSQVEKGHPERQIKNYYKKITSDKKTKNFHELVIQVGNHKNQLPVSETNDLYKDFLNQFQQSNPQLKVIGAYIHNDESTPHMHLDYIPVADYKRGMSRRISNDKAITQMGYKSWNDWRDAQMQTLEHCLEQKGHEREVMYNKFKHIESVERFKSVAEYRETISELQKEVSELEIQFDEQKSVLNKTQAIIARKRALIDSQNQEIQFLEKEAQKIFDEPMQAVYKSEEFQNFKSLVESNDLDHLDSLEYLSKEDPKITVKQGMFQSEPMVTMPLSHWNSIVDKHNRLVDIVKGIKNQVQQKLENLKSILVRKPITVSQGQIKFIEENLGRFEGYLYLEAKQSYKTYLHPFAKYKNGTPVQVIKVRLPSASRRELQFEPDKNGIDRNCRDAYIYMPVDIIEPTNLKHRRKFKVYDNYVYTVEFQSERRKDGSFDSPEKVKLNAQEIKKVFSNKIISKVVERVIEKPHQKQITRPEPSKVLQKTKKRNYEIER